MSNCADQRETTRIIELLCPAVLAIERRKAISGVDRFSCPTFSSPSPSSLIGMQVSTSRQYLSRLGRAVFTVGLGCRLPLSAIWSLPAARCSRGALASPSSRYHTPEEFTIALLHPLLAIRLKSRTLPCRGSHSDLGFGQVPLN